MKFTLILFLCVSVTGTRLLPIDTNCTSYGPPCDDEQNCICNCYTTAISRGIPISIVGYTFTRNSVLPLFNCREERIIENCVCTFGGTDTPICRNDICVETKETKVAPALFLFLFLLLLPILICFSLCLLIQRGHDKSTDSPPEYENPPEYTHPNEITQSEESV